MLQQKKQIASLAVYVSNTKTNTGLPMTVKKVDGTTSVSNCTDKSRESSSHQHVPILNTISIEENLEQEGDEL